MRKFTQTHAHTHTRDCTVDNSPRSCRAAAILRRQFAEYVTGYFPLHCTLPSALLETVIVEYDDFSSLGYYILTIEGWVRG